MSEVIVVIIKSLMVEGMSARLCLGILYEDFNLVKGINLGMVLRWLLKKQRLNMWVIGCDVL